MPIDRRNNSYTERRVSARCPFFVFVLCLAGVGQALFLTSCHTSSHKTVPQTDQVDSVVPLHYAQGFEIALLKDGGRRVTVFRLWDKDKEVWQRYYLYDDSSLMTPSRSDDGVFLTVPLNRVALGSCTQVEFFRLLNALTKVKGMADADKVYNPELRQALAEGRLCDLGDAFQLRIEPLLRLKTDAVMLTGISQMSAQVDMLERSGLPVIFNNEWTENNLLGRAEWLRFVGAFLDCQDMADSMFMETENRYLALRQLADSLSAGDHRTVSVLSGEDFRGTWYLPGGNSYMAQLFRDAGFDYIYQNDSTSGSIACPFEQVLYDLNDADVWVGVDASDLTSLLSKDSRYALFKAYRQGKVFAYDARSAAGGANDFWESAVAHPDLILADFIKLRFPEFCRSWEWNFLRPLSE